jgi:class 3 adenylate cyclase
MSVLTFLFTDFEGSTRLWDASSQSALSVTRAASPS